MQLDDLFHRRFQFQREVPAEAAARAEDLAHAPVDSNLTPRFSGVATFMRLPLVSGPSQLDIAIFGVPWDGGTTNRPGARHGPRQVREMSSLIRRFHGITKVAPSDLCRIGDLGDSPTNPVDLGRSLHTIEEFATQILQAGARPLAIGGDHLCTLPLLRAFAEAHPLGLIHFDAHHDMDDTYFGDARYTHGTPFRRAIEEGLIDPARTIQVGIRGSTYDNEEERWALERGVRVVRPEVIDERGVQPVIEEIRRVIGEGPSYLSFDVDCIDPAFAPGTGTPEFGGLLPREINQLLRGLSGLHIAGADVVEVSPPFDLGGITALAAANVGFEILCLMAESVARNADGASRGSGRGEELVVATRRER